MTEDTVAANDLATVVHRRLTGLLVLLLLAFGLSLLTRLGGGKAAESMQTVVIPLSPSAGPVSALPPAPLAESSTATSPMPSTPVESPSMPKTAERLPAPEPAAPRLEAATSKPTSPAHPEGMRVTSPQSKPKPPPVTATKPSGPVSKTDAPKPPPVAMPRRWFVVVGAFKDPVAAQAIGARIKLAGLKGDTQAVVLGKEHLVRVRAGPFLSQSQAESARATLIVEGLTKAAVVSEK